MTTASVREIEVQAESLDLQHAAALYNEYGCLVIRGLMKPYLPDLYRDITATAEQSLRLLPQAKQVAEGWVTPDGTLFIPAPPGFERDRQIMVLAVNYQTSGSFFRAALDDRLLDVAASILGPNVELFMNGQCLYKEPVGGHPKHLHQDASYFEHRFEGPVGALSYVVDTDLTNGALHVVPGSHRMGLLEHVDTFSHLGLDEREWPWERAVPVVGSAGDTILFHYKTIHGSKENHSELPRPVIINRYRRPDDYVVVSATTTEKRAEAAKRAAEANKNTQRGLMLRGFRPFDP